MSLILDGSLGTTFNDGSNQSAAASPYTLKNRIINGDFRIDQRNAGASVTPANAAYTLDRWQAFQSVASKYSVQQNAAAVTPPTGFTNYLGVTSLSAYSVASGDYFALNQSIEGFNVADLAWGTANAQTVTLSFWVRSSLTGTFGGALKNSAGNRSYPFTYTISVANTWEQKTITIAGDTSGTWVTNNGIGIYVQLGLGTGSTWNGTAGAWAAGNFISATGATSVVGTNGATFYITGVQLEVGSSATPFERRLYNQELANCQRYYETSYNQGNTPQVVPTNVPNSYAFLSSGTNTIGGGTGTAQQTMGPFFFKVQKRALSTVTIYSYSTSTTSMAGNGWTGSDLAANSGSIGDTYTYGFSVINKSGGNVATGGYGIIFGYSASAEL
jgi:hypothetical protein